MTRFLVGSVGFAVALVWQAAVAPAPSAGAVQGIVTRGDTGTPLSNVKVSLSGGPSDPVSVQALLSVFKSAGVTVPEPPPEESEKLIQALIDAAALRGISTGIPTYQTALQRFRSANEERFVAISDTEGHFMIEAVPPAEYTIRAQREGFFGGESEAVTLPVKILSRATVDAKLSLFPGAAISGRIMDGAGEGQPNVTVNAYQVTYVDGIPRLNAVASRTTDDRGEYRLFWFAPGNYLVAAQPRPVDPAVTRAASGAAAVLPRPQLAPTFFPAATDAGTAASITVGRSDISGIDIPLQSVVPVKISGQIRFIAPQSNAETRGPVPPSTAEIMLLTRDINVPEQAGPSARVVGNATLRAGSGTFEFGGIFPGSYEIFARLPFASPNDPVGLIYAHTPVDVTRDGASGIQIVAFPPAQVKGTVRIDGHPPGKTAVRVGLQVDGTASKIPLYQGIARRPIVAGEEDGAFSIPLVLPGHFRVDVRGLPPEFYLADVLLGGSSVFDSGFDIGGETQLTLQVIVRSGAATLMGVVVNAAGKPVPNASVVIAPPMMDRRQNRSLYASAVTDSTGRFLIRGIFPGGYKVFAWETAIPSGAYFNSVFLARYEDRGRPINLTETATADVTIPAIPAGE